MTLILDGWHGDTSRMYSAGNPSVKARNLINNTYEAMMKGINLIKPGVKLGDLGFVIQIMPKLIIILLLKSFVGMA